MDELISQLRTAIISQSLPPPSPNLLTTLVSSRSPPLPVPSLLATAKARILACDLTAARSIVDSSALYSLPPRVDDAAVKEVKLPRDVHVQVLDIENLSLSRWEQVEELEAIERGESTRGREIVRVTAAEEQDTGYGSQEQQQRQAASGGASATPANAGRNATHRLVLQDCTGKRVYAVELRRIDRIGLGKTNIGEKMLLKSGTAVSRGTVLLTPDNYVLLGGKIEAWHKVWTEGRLARLKEAAGANGQGQ